MQRCWHRLPFQSTPSAWRETVAHINQCDSLVISIHSLRMEGDIVAVNDDFSAQLISIHSLRMEGDQVTVCVHNRRTQFQSTPSAWRETFSGKHSPISDSFQSTPSAWRETQIFQHKNCNTHHFNPLPPHGGRLRYTSTGTPRKHFNPLPPHGGRLSDPACHAAQGRDFNPLPPHGGRHDSTSLLFLL